MRQPERAPSTRRLVAALCVALIAAPLGGGCATSTSKRTVTEKIRVTTTPPGAFVWRKDAEGRRSLGRAPRTVERRYQVTTTRYNRWTNLLWLLGTSGATVGSFAGFAAVDEGETGARVALMTGGIVVGIMALGHLIAAITGEVRPVIEKVTPAPLQIGASLPGHLDAWSDLKTPHGKKPLQLALSPGGGGTPRANILGNISADAAGALLAKNKGPSPESPVVAVFDIQDASRRLKASVLDQLTEYLATQVTAVARYQVVPRRQLRARLAEQKREGFKACYDTACQIELGKAVAAQRSLATKLLRVGGRCALTAVLYDLKRETSVGAASVDTACSLDALMGGVRQLADELARPR